MRTYIDRKYKYCLFDILELIRGLKNNILPILHAYNSWK